MKLYIKFMVSQRCLMMVKKELITIGIPHAILELGMAEIPGSITPEQRNILKANLLRSGLELLDDKKSILIERIKNVITEMIHHTDELPQINFSEHISNTLELDYTYLANMFSEVTGITIQQFIILNKIERVKELLLYQQLNMTQIASKMQYSSVGHLSNQFKKMTGLTPSFYQKLKHKRMQNLENV